VCLYACVRARVSVLSVYALLLSYAIILSVPTRLYITFENALSLEELCHIKNIPMEHQRILHIHALLDKLILSSCTITKLQASKLESNSAGEHRSFLSHPVHRTPSAIFCRLRPLLFFSPDEHTDIKYSFNERQFIVKYSFHYRDWFCVHQSHQFSLGPNYFSFFSFRLPLWRSPHHKE